MKLNSQFRTPTLARRITRVWSALALGVGALLCAPRVAHAFGSEDVLRGPFYHERITERAAQTALPLGVPFEKKRLFGQTLFEPDSSLARGRFLVGTEKNFSPLLVAGVAGISDDIKLLPTMERWQFTGTYAGKTSLDPDSTDALNTLGWHADYIDSYLYSPLWWVQGLPSLDRFKTSLATRDELKKLHFDDLFTTDQVNHMWRRYTTGTMAGLLWAAEKDDVHAAQNIVGVSLHAMQDFYAHSNWVDDPARRDKTYFEMWLRVRPGLPLQTGAYEKAGHLGVHQHGKFVFECSIMNQPGMKETLGVACSAISPLSNEPICQTYSDCGRGVTVQHQVKGVTVPKGLIYLAPAGIALDNYWMSGIAVRERKLSGVTGDQMFEVAETLAQRQSQQWLQTLESNMTRLGKGDFWRKVCTTHAARKQRTRQFEDYGQLPYQFLSAGPYPPTVTDKEEVYLRVKLTTARANNSGTNADIRLSAGPHRNVLLDYSGGRGPILNYNDFSAGDSDVYVVGPFDSVPSTLQLRNDAPNTGDVFLALGRSFVDAIAGSLNGIVNTAKFIMGTDADHIRTSQKVFAPDDLARVHTAQEKPATTKTMRVLNRDITIPVPAGDPFMIDLNGGKEGHYQLNGYILKTGESAESGSQGWREFEVKLTTLYCVKESAWDRGSNSDEPFITALLVPLPGTMQRYRSSLTQRINGKDEPISIDKGQSVFLNKTFDRVRIPKDVGYLNLPVAAWEHDDETGAAREKLLNTFAGDVEQKTISARNGFVSALGGSMGSSWQLSKIEVTAWSRNQQVRVGTVLNQSYNGWIAGGKTASFNLNPGGMTTYKVSAASLLVDLSPLGGALFDDKVNDLRKLPDGVKVPPFDSAKKKSDKRLPGDILIPQKKLPPVGKVIPKGRVIPPR